MAQQGRQTPGSIGQQGRQTPGSVAGSPAGQQGRLTPGAVGQQQGPPTPSSVAGSPGTTQDSHPPAQLTDDQQISKFYLEDLDFNDCNIIIPPVYEVYRGYIVFAFSVRMFVCVCVCKLFFPSKISQKLLDLGS